jgi:hypothetical protein
LTQAARQTDKFKRCFHELICEQQGEGVDFKVDSTIAAGCVNDRTSTSEFRSNGRGDVSSGVAVAPILSAWEIICCPSAHFSIIADSVDFSHRNEVKNTDATCAEDEAYSFA